MSVQEHILLNLLEQLLIAGILVADS